MEINLDRQEPLVLDPRKVKEKLEITNGDNAPIKNEKKETMAESVAHFSIVPRTAKTKNKKPNIRQEQERRKPTLKEM